uniref:Uncharacterized protein n=1 Tax=Acrobeloides nanus TaxID=290746 RepID=A0A914CAW9_9BILA
VDLSQLFSDVSRTVSGIRSILGQQSSASAQMPQDLNARSSASNDIPQADSPTSPLANLFGSSSGVCFKTCGMEDIQFAARRAGEMLMTMRVCMIVLTALVVVCALALTIAIVLYLYKSRDAFARLRHAISEESSVSGTPLISHHTNQSPLYGLAKRPPPPIPLPKQLASATTIASTNTESS